jgi:hypothetical protein
LYKNLVDFAPTSLALCYHRASPASFCCSCDFSPASLPSYLVLKMSQMLKLYFAPVLSRCGDWFTVTLKSAPLPELPRADCTGAPVSKCSMHS